jgi:hypothetical protein
MYAIENKVLPGDLEEARKEHECMTQCLFLAWRSAKYGHYETMDQLIHDAQKSEKQLDKLFQERKTVEKLNKEFAAAKSPHEVEIAMTMINTYQKIHGRY